MAGNLQKNHSIITNHTGNSCSDASYVQLNVGGKIFCTTRATLLKDSQSLFARILRYEHGDLCLHDDHGNIFIDRNPRCFEHILDYLRDAKFFCRPDELPSLLNEAQYYRLLGMVKAVQNEMLEKREMERYAASHQQHSSGSTAFLKRNSSPTISLTSAGTTNLPSDSLLHAQANVIVELMKRIEDSCRGVWIFCSQIRVGDDGYLLVKRH